MCLCVHVKKEMIGGKALRYYFKKNRRLCTQLFKIKRLLFSNCLLSSKLIGIRLRLHTLQILLALLMLLTLERMLYFWFGTIPVKILPN